MGIKTKIDWCDSTWNPVTGCLHDCPYCYARGIVNRFKGGVSHYENKRTDGLHDLNAPAKDLRGGKRMAAPYPYGFEPTLHRYLFEQPKKWVEPRTVFVCSMADLFGKWVPDEWIAEVIDACIKAPQHRYIFLTKNPSRYLYLIDNGIIPEDQPNLWLGSTVTTPEHEFFWHHTVNTFVSIEPIIAPFGVHSSEGQRAACFVNWIIIGAETGNRKDKVIPKKRWIDEIVAEAKKAGTPVFMKESLKDLMGADFIQQLPWDKPGQVLAPADSGTLLYADNPTV